MQLQNIFITLVAVAVTGTYALPAENSANACFRQCGSVPDCPKGTLTKQPGKDCYTCCQI